MDNPEISFFIYDNIKCTDRNPVILKSVVDLGYNIIPIAVAHIIQLQDNKSIQNLNSE